MRRTSPLFAFCVLVAAIGGCPMMPPNGNGNANTNTNDNGNDNSNTLVLSAAQKAEINGAAAALTHAGLVLSTYSGLVDPQLDIESLGAIGLGVFGECPEVAFAASELSIVIDINFKNGCGSDKTDGVMISGRFSLTLERQTRSATIGFDGLLIDGQSISGTATLEVRGNAAMGMTFRGEADLMTGDGKAIAGDLTFRIDANGVITIDSEALVLRDGGSTFTLGLDGVVLDPAGNGNFTPEAGVVTIMATSGENIEIKFGAQSPVDGTVSVMVGERGPAEYDIPGM